MFYDYKLTKRDEIKYCFQGTVEINIYIYYKGTVKYMIIFFKRPIKFKRKEIRIEKYYIPNM